MRFQSILFEGTEEPISNEPVKAPDFFADLHLDQMVDTLTVTKQEYHLKPFFFTPLRTITAIAYRYEILRDLEHPALLEQVQTFAQKLHTMRDHLTQADKLYYRYQKERWFLDAVALYCDAVTGLLPTLQQTNLQSQGLLAFRDWLTDYVRSEYFASMLIDTKKLKADLSTVHYSLLIQGNRVKVRKYTAETDLSADVADTFEKFKQGAVKDYRAKLSTWPDMNHVEAQILEMVAKLYPDIFAHLDDYCAKNAAYLDQTLARFDREIQFYIAYLEYVARLKRAGLHFCYPDLSTSDKDVYAYETFDAPLADKLLNEKSPVVCNDFSLHGSERLIVITGPNQGGKTTFARSFGQAHYLASIGCLVPGRKARLLLCDQIFTHFEREEQIQDLRGKLQDDLVRMRSILNQATSNSLIILNEIFTSTTLQDAVFLSTRILEEISRLDALGVCVTFIDELATLNEKTVSMVSTVVPEHPAIRTFKIVRRPADGLAYALAIAEKYRLTYESIKERIRL